MDKKVIPVLDMESRSSAVPTGLKNVLYTFQPIDKSMGYFLPAYQSLLQPVIKLSVFEYGRQGTPCPYLVFGITFTNSNFCRGDS